MVGAKAHGMMGRYVAPNPLPDTPSQALYKEAGFDTVNELSNEISNSALTISLFRSVQRNVDGTRVRTRK